MKKPSVLVFIDWYLPGTKAGGPVRSVANLVAHLSDKIDFSIVTTDTDYTETRPYSNIEADNWVSYPNGMRVWYCSKERVGKETFNRILAEQDYDAYYVNGIYSRNFSILPLQVLKKKQAPVIVAVRGMLAEGPMKFGALKKRVFLALAKLTGLYKNVIFQATKPVEEEDIKKHIGKSASVKIVANLPRAIAPERKPIVKNPGELKIICLARIAVEKNNIYAIQRLASIHDNVQLDLCGSLYDDDYWKRCKEQIALLPANVHVRLIDVVAGDDVPELLSNYHLMFLPTRGENFGHVIFETLSAGRPVLISDRTPWLGLKADLAGMDIPLEKPEDFAAAITEFTKMDQAEYDKWSQGAFDYVLRYLAQDRTTDKYLELFRK